MQALSGWRPGFTSGNRRLRPAVLTLRLTNAGRTALLRSGPPYAAPGSRGSNRSRGSRPQNGLPRLCRRLALSRDPAPAVSDRLDFRKLPEAPDAQGNFAIGLRPLQINPAGCPKGMRS